MAPDFSNTRIWVALLITTLWAVSYVVSVTSTPKDYTGFSIATSVMLLAGAWLLSSDIRKRNSNSDE